MVNAALFDIKGYDYRWAEEQLCAGKRVRRKCWPMHWVEKGARVPHSDGDYIVPETFLACWHVWPRTDGMPKEYGLGFVGWGGQIGADGAESIMGHTDGTGFSPTAEDALANDWELAFPKQDG